MLIDVLRTPMITNQNLFFLKFFEVSKPTFLYCVHVSGVIKKNLIGCNAYDVKIDAYPFLWHKPSKNVYKCLKIL